MKNINEQEQKFLTGKLSNIVAESFNNALSQAESPEERFLIIGTILAYAIDLSCSATNADFVLKQVTYQTSEFKKDRKPFFTKVSSVN